MALSNSQYDQLMRTYEQRQLDNEYQLRRRYEKAYSLIPALEELDHSISSLSVEKARSLLDGNQGALSSLKEDVHSLSNANTSCLNPMDCQRITWNFIIPARTVRIRDISARKSATVLRRPLWIFCTRSQIYRKY